MKKPEWKKKMDTHARIGAAIRAARDEGQVTQRYLAKFIGCGQSAVSALERGKVGSVELVEAVCWALGLELGRLSFDRPRVPTSIKRAARTRREMVAAPPVDARAARRRAPDVEEPRRASFFR